MNAATHLILVNNTCLDIEMVKPMLLECVRKNQPLPEDLTDLFTLEIIEVDGLPRGIVGMA